MQFKGKFFEDIGALASSAANTASHLKKEVDHKIQAKFEEILKSTDMISREEFEVVKAMAQKAREENVFLKAELETLKKRPKK